MLQSRGDGCLRSFDFGDSTRVSQRLSLRLEPIVQQEGARGIANAEVDQPTYDNTRHLSEAKQPDMSCADHALGPWKNQANQKRHEFRRNVAVPFVPTCGFCCLLS